MVGVQTNQSSVKSSPAEQKTWNVAKLFSHDVLIALYVVQV